MLNYTTNDGQVTWFPQSNFDESLSIDHRYFNAQGIEPRYAFGHGLSYTTFGYTRLLVQKLDQAVAGLPDPKIPHVQGGHPQLWDTEIIVTVDITNTGSVPGFEVAQLYLRIPVENTPVR